MEDPLNEKADLIILIKDKIEGAILAALIGDAIGSAIEFSINPSKEKVLLAMKLIGSEIHKTQAGQITDDGELLLSLGRALKDSKFDLNEIAVNYNAWFKSKPFDIGNTFRNALNKSSSSKMKEQSIKVNMEKMSNGGLMKLIPLSIYCRNLNLKEMISYIYQECELTHPNPMCKISNLIYTLMIKSIFEGKDRKESYTSMKSIILDPSNKKDIFANSVCKEAEREYKVDSLVQEIENWFDIIEKGKDFSKSQIGYIKVALVLSISIFLQGADFSSSMYKMLTFGGDTDTNCCILGGLIGAFEGKKKLPEEYIKKVLSCDPSKSGNRRRGKDFIPKYNLDQIYSNLNNPLKG